MKASIGFILLAATVSLAACRFESNKKVSARNATEDQGVGGGESEGALQSAVTPSSSSMEATVKVLADAIIGEWYTACAESIEVNPYSQTEETVGFYADKVVFTADGQYLFESTPYLDRNCTVKKENEDLGRGGARYVGRGTYTVDSKNPSLKVVLDDENKTSDFRIESEFVQKITFITNKQVRQLRLDLIQQQTYFFENGRRSKVGDDVDLERSHSDELVTFLYRDANAARNIKIKQRYINYDSSAPEGEL